MTHISRPTLAHEQALTRGAPRRSRRLGLAAITLAALAALIGVAWLAHAPAAQPSAPPTPRVTVAAPLSQTVTATTDFLGQFSAVDTIELRAQVGGTLASIGFRDGQIVHAGDVLFTIDPRPYQVRLEQAAAQMQSAEARKTLTAAELWRAAQLRRTDFGSAETLDQRAADQRAAEASAASAKAAIDDAKLDLEFARLAAPFTGRIGAHLVSVGSLVSGSRAGATATTLLTTLVSLDPIHLDFDMSEADYLAFRRAHPGADAAPVDVVLANEAPRAATLDFIDNAMDRASGTIHARATVPNPDLSLTPGQFARAHVVTGAPETVLLIPAAAVVPDQSRQTVLVLGADGTVSQKPVTTGGLHDGLRVVRAGLSPDDRVVIDGMALVRPGAKAEPVAGHIEPGTSR